MNPANPRNDLPDVAEVYFSDGTQLGPAIQMRSVGSELPELILGTFKQLNEQNLLPCTIGTASAALIYRAVVGGNHVSANAPPNQFGFSAQLSYLFQREHALGGIGVVIVDIAASTVTTYGGRGFPVAGPSNPFMPCTFGAELLANEPASGIEAPAAAPAPKRAQPKKKAKKKKAGRKRASRKTNAAPMDVTVR